LFGSIGTQVVIQARPQVSVATPQSTKPRVGRAGVTILSCGPLWETVRPVKAFSYIKRSQDC